MSLWFSNLKRNLQLKNITKALFLGDTNHFENQVYFKQSTIIELHKKREIQNSNQWNIWLKHYTEK